MPGNGLRGKPPQPLFAPAFSPHRRSELEEGGWICRDLADFRRTLGDDEPLGSNGDWKVSEKIGGEVR